mmetsp:Transcript_3626/g.9147  ORF Transcript_3626/g.9147 Transcript_3626/m.9147 type:complete len:480 (-) Transcript_3626:45-1484(-)
MLLDVDHSLVEDGPNDQVHDLSAHPVVVARPDRKREDVTRHQRLDYQQDLDHAYHQMRVRHGVLRVHSGQNHGDVVAGDVAFFQDGVLIFQGVGQAAVQAPFGEEGGDPDPDDLRPGRAVLEELLLVRVKEPLVDEVAQVVAAQPLAVPDVPRVHLPRILEQELDAQDSIAQDGFLGLLVLLGVAGEVHGEPRAHRVNRVQNALQQLVPNVPPNVHRLGHIQAEQEAHQGGEDLGGVRHDLELVQHLPHLRQILVVVVPPRHDRVTILGGQVADGEGEHGEEDERKELDPDERSRGLGEDRPLEDREPPELGHPRLVEAHHLGRAVPLADDFPPQVRELVTEPQVHAVPCRAHRLVPHRRRGHHADVLVDLLPLLETCMRLVHGFPCAFEPLIPETPRCHFDTLGLVFHQEGIHALHHALVEREAALRAADAALVALLHLIPPRRTPRAIHHRPTWLVAVLAALGVFLAKASPVHMAEG